MGWSSLRPVLPPALTSVRWVTGCFTKEDVRYFRNVHKYCWERSYLDFCLIRVFIFPLASFSSPSLVWQNWCCRLTRETWTACWDLWMIIWTKPVWMKRKVVEVSTTTLRRPAPVRHRLIAVEHFFFFCSPS